MTLYGRVDYYAVDGYLVFKHHSYGDSYVPFGVYMYYYGAYA